MKHDRFLANNPHYIKYLINTHSCEYFPHTKYFPLQFINFSDPGMFTKRFQGTLVSYTHFSNQVRCHVFREGGLSVLLKSDLKCGLSQANKHNTKGYQITQWEPQSFSDSFTSSDYIKQGAPVGNERSVEIVPSLANLCFHQVHRRPQGQSSESSCIQLAFNNTSCCHCIVIYGACAGFQRTIMISNSFTTKLIKQ